MKNIEIAKICGLCAGCERAVNCAIKSLYSNNRIVLFKEIVHNKRVNLTLQKHGVVLETELTNLTKNDLVVLRAHGEPPKTYEYLNSRGIEYVDCTCVNVKNIHNSVQKYSGEGYDIVYLGKYGKFTNVMHPEVLGTLGYISTNVILIEDQEDIKKINKIKTPKLYLVCQTTFNHKLADLIINKVQNLCRLKGIELIVNRSICAVQQNINNSSLNLAKNSDVMVVVGSPNSSNTKELYNNLKDVTKCVFLEDIENWQSVFKENNLDINSDIKIGITAGASTLKEDLLLLKIYIEKQSKISN